MCFSRYDLPNFRTPTSNEGSQEKEAEVAATTSSQKEGQKKKKKKKKSKEGAKKRKEQKIKAEEEKNRRISPECLMVMAVKEILICRRVPYQGGP